MNKGTLLIVQLIAITAALGHSVGGLFHSSSKYQSSHNLPSGQGRHKFRPHAPNDGRWHMKYHRGRK